MAAAPIALDTNLAILLAVGATDTGYISKHKRLRPFDETDFAILDELIGLSAGVVWCPNVLSETSNLVRYVNDPIRSEVAVTLKRLIETWTETVIGSRTAASRDEYVRLGLGDTVLLTLAANGATLLTDDLDLHHAALAAGHQSVNFNEFRDERRDFRQ